MATPQEEALKSLERIQQFDPKRLVRDEDLGKKNFSTAIDPASRLIALYQRLSVRALDDFPPEQLRQVTQRANADYQLFDQVLSFDVDRTTADRDSLVAQISNAYGQSFSVLHPLIAYSLHRSADFQRLDSEARATIQSVKDQVGTVTTELDDARKEAQRILGEVRSTAAEAGVSQQAAFFRDAADSYEASAKVWGSSMARMAWATGLFALLSAFAHKVPLLRPESSYDTVQLAVSKVLVFAVLAFLLVQAARNFHANRHNAVVNRHRQQALQTYRTLVDAAGDDANRDIVLTHAASCIFAPQTTGHSNEGASGAAPSAKSVVELLGQGSRGNSG